MYIGSQRARIQIWRDTQVGVDGYGTPIVESSVWKETWAQVAARRGNEHSVDSEVFALTNWFITCRYESVKGVRPTDRIVMNGQIYEIRNIMPDEQKKDSCVIEARIQNVNMQGGDSGGGEDPAPTFTAALSSAMPDAKVGEFFMSPIINVTGGKSPFSYAVVLVAPETLPAGLTISATTGLISGVPTEADEVEFDITVTDSEGAVATITDLKIKVTA